MNFIAIDLGKIKYSRITAYLIYIVFGLTSSCGASLEVIKSNPIQTNCPNFGTLTLPNGNAEILYINNLYPLESSIVKIKGNPPPYFFGSDYTYYSKHAFEFIALPGGKVIEKQYATNALEIDDWERISYFKHAYFKACPEVKEIPFWNKIKVVKDDNETKARVASLVHQKGIQSIIELIQKASTATEIKRYYWIINDLLDEKASIYLKRNFPKYSKYADYKLTWSDGEDSGYRFKELFRLCLNKNPHTGASFDKTGFYIKNGDTSQDFEIHMKKKDTGEIDIFGPEFFFHINEGYITLTGLKQGNIRNAKAWEIIASEAIRLFSNQIEIESFDFNFLNKELIDSLK
ncbi:hypothetical protein ACQV5M_15185 [Leptospira sp. SA-E8]|uniref:hypothetical protein n=1 Tax=Leptospira sp. SA-E8 TaxID=3422259 RepID=UPI003EBD3837